jgi:hypothetical protein
LCTRTRMPAGTWGLVMMFHRQRPAIAIRNFEITSRLDPRRRFPCTEIHSASPASAPKSHEWDLRRIVHRDRLINRPLGCLENHRRSSVTTAGASSRVDSEFSGRRANKTPILCDLTNGLPRRSFFKPHKNRSLDRGGMGQGLESNHQIMG